MECEMPRYRIRIENGSPDEHFLDLADDTTAIEETLETAAGLIRDFGLRQPGTKRQRIELAADNGTTVVKIDIEAVRGR